MVCQLPLPLVLNLCDLSIIRPVFVIPQLLSMQWLWRVMAPLGSRWHIMKYLLKKTSAGFLNYYHWLLPPQIPGEVSLYMAELLEYDNFLLIFNIPNTHLDTFYGFFEKLHSPSLAACLFSPNLQCLLFYNIHFLNCFQWINIAPTALV